MTDIVLSISHAFIHGMPPEPPYSATIPILQIRKLSQGGCTRGPTAQVASRAGDADLPGAVWLRRLCPESLLLLRDYARTRLGPSSVFLLT